MILFVAFACLVIGSVLGLLVASMLAAGSREEECHRCVEATRRALGATSRKERTS